MSQLNDSENLLSSPETSRGGQSQTPSPNSSFVISNDAVSISTQYKNTKIESKPELEYQDWFMQNHTKLKEKFKNRIGECCLLLKHDVLFFDEIVTEPNDVVKLASQKFPQLKHPIPATLGYDNIQPFRHLKYVYIIVIFKIHFHESSKYPITNRFNFSNSQF